MGRYLPVPDPCNPCDKLAPMEPAESADVTGLLIAWSQGSRSALERLMPKVYDELRRMAQGHLNRERAGHTLQATALVNEVYLRLASEP